MDRRLSILSILLLVSILGACGNASMIRKDRHGGEIAMSGSYMVAAADARRGHYAVLAKRMPPPRPTAPAAHPATARLGDLSVHGFNSMPSPEQRTFAFACATAR